MRAFLADFGFRPIRQFVERGPQRRLQVRDAFGRRTMLHRQTIRSGQPRHLARNLRPERGRRLRQLKRVLQMQPPPRRSPEIPAQIKIGRGRDAALPVDDGVQALHRNGRRTGAARTSERRARG